MKKIVVLGAGMVGRTIALDLSKAHNVVSVDMNLDNLNILKSRYSIETVHADVTDFSVLNEIIRDRDIVVSAVPGYLGFETLKKIILAKKNVVDIAFFPEDALELDELAKENDVTAVVDCGVAPGISNLVLGRYNSLMKVNSFECYVGGLPVKREMPFQYKAPFSPVDVIEEYTRPAKLVENGCTVIKPALSEPEYMNFDEVGTLEAFNTDGLRSLTKTMKIPFMKEKTLRYPGHIQLMQALKAGGFFEMNEIECRGLKLKPFDFTCRILFDKWLLSENDDEFTIMKIIVQGEENGKTKSVVYDMYDRRDPETGMSSMARTTGYACTAAVNLVLNKQFTRKGISPPEFLGENEICFDFIFDYMKERGVVYRKSILSD